VNAPQTEAEIRQSQDETVAIFKRIADELEGN